MAAGCVDFPYSNCCDRVVDVFKDTRVHAYAQEQRFGRWVVRGAAPREACQQWHQYLQDRLPIIANTGLAQNHGSGQGSVVSHDAERVWVLYLQVWLRRY